MGEIAADGAAVADLRMGDVGQRLVDSGSVARDRADRARGCDSGSARRCARRSVAPFTIPASSVSGLISIRIAGWVEPEIHRRHQALAAGQKARLVAVFGLERQGLLEVRAAT